MISKLFSFAALCLWFGVVLLVDVNVLFCEEGEGFSQITPQSPPDFTFELLSRAVKSLDSLCVLWGDQPDHNKKPPDFCNNIVALAKVRVNRRGNSHREAFVYRIRNTAGLCN